MTFDLAFLVLPRGDIERAQVFHETPKRCFLAIKIAIMIFFRNSFCSSDKTRCKAAACKRSALPAK